LGKFVKYIVGVIARSVEPDLKKGYIGPRVSPIDRRRRKRFPIPWIGIFGWARRRIGITVQPTFPLIGEAGGISGPEH
jgi:hypothetical protein